MTRNSIFVFLLSLVFTVTPVGQFAFSQTLDEAIQYYQDGKYKRAERHWQQLAEAGNADALFNLGQMYHLGQGADFNDNKAADYYLAAANLGHTAAARELGNLYFFSPRVNGGREAALRWWQKAAREGDGKAQYILGILYFNGDGVAQNLTLGYAWTLLAVDAGISEAIQSQTAMRGQLSAEQHYAAFQMTQTLMTGTPQQAAPELLVGEVVQKPREIQVTSGEVPLPPKKSETKEAEMSNPPALDETEVSVAEEEVVREDILVVSEPESAVSEEVDEQQPEEGVVDAPSQAAVDQTQRASNELLETREVLENLIDETAPTHQEALPEEEYDLGDPLSPLVAESNFSPDWSVQLTSFRKPENAEAHWQKVLGENPEIFSGAEKRIIRYDLGPERGVYYRLRIGPYRDKDSADRKCLEIQEAGLDCLVIWP